MPARTPPEDFFDATEAITYTLLKLKMFVTLLQGNGNNTSLDLNSDDISGICLFMDEIVEDIEVSNDLMFEFCKREGK